MMKDIEDLQEEFMDMDFVTLMEVASMEYDLDADEYHTRSDLIDAMIAIEQNNRVK